MYIRQILVFIILLGFQASAAPVKKTGKTIYEQKEEAPFTLAKDSDKLFSDFLSHLNQKKTSQDKLAELKKFENDFTKLRAGEKRRLDEELEVNLGILEESLELIPRKDFDKSQCDKIRHDILFQFEPTSAKKPENVSLKKTFQVVDSLCK